MSTVATVYVDMSTVATVYVEMSTEATLFVEMSTVAMVYVEMSTVATVYVEMSTLATLLVGVSTVATLFVEMSTVGTLYVEMSTVATLFVEMSTMTTLATIKSEPYGNPCVKKYNTRTRHKRIHLQQWTRADTTIRPYRASYADITNQSTKFYHWIQDAYWSLKPYLEKSPHSFLPDQVTTWIPTQTANPITVTTERITIHGTVYRIIPIHPTNVDHPTVLGQNDMKV